jgi:threonylcarbamoyladenosine tRNA methylthiotransferase CDKAL1
MADILNHPRVYAFLHIPVQCGSNSVLDKMNREYTKEEFDEVCGFLAKHVAHVNLATDIICGFPTETKKDHEETLALIEQWKFPALNISQFYPRPGTVAAKWKLVPTKVVKERSKEVTNLFNSYSTYSYFMEDPEYKEQLVWVSGMEEKNQDQLMGHTKNYSKVVMKSFKEGVNPKDLIGKVVKVKIVDAQKWHIEGQIIDYSPEMPKVDPEYFTKIDAQRKAERELKKQQRKELSKLKSNEENLGTHLLGMAMFSVGFWMVLRNTLG